MFRKILIANRGEIALRIIRTCREMGIATVAVYSKADRDSLHVRFADESVCIGPPSPVESYLSIPRIISAAEITDADAIHPGYGFLAENAHFAEICESCNIAFIGPSSHAISVMGDKSSAREMMKKSKVPTLPGSDGIVKSSEDALDVARQMGYPVMIKASAGGGGRGMRIAHNDGSLVQSFNTAQAEAESAFKDSRVYIEKLLVEPRHIEVQVLADKHGTILHLGERDCSLQRRHQKVIEESPSPVVNDKLRYKIGDAAVRCAKAVNYNSVGTVEFLMDKDGNFYFMEMNTRIQVEHPVTELVTGIDLIKEQIKVAFGEKLKLRQKDITLKGHSIECRINAEDPYNNFTPSPGKITGLHFPGGPGIRIDSHVYSEYVVPPFYDSLLAKLIVHAETRKEAIGRMRSALQEFVIEGIQSNVPIQQLIVNDHDFISGNFHTSHLETIRHRLDYDSKG